jgi:hypothetical protein
MAATSVGAADDRGGGFRLYFCALPALAFDAPKIASEMVLRIYMTIGFTALLGLAALAVTSTDAMIAVGGGSTGSACIASSIVAADLDGGAARLAPFLSRPGSGLSGCADTSHSAGSQG